MNWSPQQQSALDDVARWLREADSPYYYLAGFAGTGKTTLAKHLAEGVDGGVLFASFTGKAAAVMRSKGCEGATTIHKLIYTSRDKSTARLKALHERLTKESDPLEKAKLRREVAKETNALKAPSFVLNHESPVRECDLVVVDECSMVDQRMGEDLLSFGKPILVLGDPAQLPPVASSGYFTKGRPHFMLTDVHRQARESGILRLATEIREGRELRHLDYGNARVIPKSHLDRDSVPGYDQIIVGTNKMRHGTNAKMRRILGFDGTYPQEGERLICVRNDHDLGLLNGECWMAVSSKRTDEHTINLTVRAESGATLTVNAQECLFRGERVDVRLRSREVQEFEWGYVVTGHKAQGSEWPRVIVFDQSYCFRRDAQAWLYTCVTRASEELTLVHG